MEKKIILQSNKNNTLIENISNEFSSNPKKVYIIAGTMKENGFKLLEEEMIDTKAKIYFAIGIDKKHTVRNMLETMLDYTNDLYVYSNNNDIEFEGTTLIFEYTNSVTVISSSSDISESGLREGINIYTKFNYDLSDKNEKEQYKAMKKELISKIEQDIFRKIGKLDIEELVNTKEIFSTKQYNHSVMSISELLGKSKKQDEQVKSEEIENEHETSTEIPKVDLSDIDLSLSDIEFEDSSEIKENEVINNVKKSSKEENILVDEESLKENEHDIEELKKISENLEDENYIDKNNELYDEELEKMDFDYDADTTLDIEDMLFSKANVKLKVDKEKKSEGNAKEDYLDDDDELVKVKKVNLNNVSNFIFELPSKSSKGQDTNNIKIPTYIKKTIPEFFGFDEDSQNVKIDGNMYKVRNITLEIIDAKTNQKYNDRNASLMQKQGQTYLTFTTDKLKEINYEECDIARIIKLSENVYHIEIISKDLKEYKLWSKVCNQNFKSSTRKYGMM